MLLPSELFLILSEWCKFMEFMQPVIMRGCRALANHSFSLFWVPAGKKMVFMDLLPSHSLLKLPDLSHSTAKSPQGGCVIFIPYIPRNRKKKSISFSFFFFFSAINWYVFFFLQRIVRLIYNTSPSFPLVHHFIFSPRGELILSIVFVWVNEEKNTRRILPLKKAMRCRRTMPTVTSE